MSRIFVIGNEKGGAGKTTCAMHLISALLDQGHKVASIDTDLRQVSLTNYINNRALYNKKNPSKLVPEPMHFSLTTDEVDTFDNLDKLKALFEQKLSSACNHAKYIIVDTPGHHSLLSRIAHSYADTVITPINDSFLDLDVMAKINPDDLSIISPSIYSQMVWEQKMQRATRDSNSIEWIVMRNRLSHVDAVNKRNVGHVLEKLAKRISFKIAPGFSERVIFRELFLHGLTLLDLTTANYEKTLGLSHVAARQELRDFLSSLNIT